MKKGKIVVIEGTDCSGKETQTSLLVQRLKREGELVERLEFPMYDSPTGKIIGGPYLGKKYICEGWFPEESVNVDPKVACLFYAADRKYNINKVTELVDKGYTVILDRYVESNMAHQGAKVEDEEERLKLYKWLETLEYELLELPKPDFTLFLYMPYKKVIELKAIRAEESDQSEKSISHIRKAEKSYLELAELHGYETINCLDKGSKLKDVLSIHEEIYKLFKSKLK